MHNWITAPREGFIKETGYSNNKIDKHMYPFGVHYVCSQKVLHEGVCLFQAVDKVLKVLWFYFVEKYFSLTTYPRACLHYWLHECVWYHYLMYVVRKCFQLMQTIVTTRPFSERNYLVNTTVEILFKSFAGSYSAYSSYYE